MSAALRSKRRKPKVSARVREQRRQRKLQRRVSRTYRPGKGRWMMRLEPNGRPKARPKLKWIPHWKTLGRKSDDQAKRRDAELRERIEASHAAAAPSLSREERKAALELTRRSSRKVWDSRRERGELRKLAASVKLKRRRGA